MKYLSFLFLTFTDWIQTKLALFAGMDDISPIVEWLDMEGILVLKVICWSGFVVLAKVLESRNPKFSHAVFSFAILVNAIVVLRNMYLIAWPIL